MIYVTGPYQRYRAYLEENDLTPRDAIHMSSENKCLAVELSVSHQVDQVVDLGDSAAARRLNNIRRRRR